MKAFLYKMTCLTNLHVGNEGSTYSVIDKEVEKDITDYPIIHASGLKGALRSRVEDAGIANKLFGKASNSKDGLGKGEYSFTDAMMLYRPLRAVGTDRASIPVITKDTVDEFLKLTEAFGCRPEGITEPQLDRIKFGSNDFLSNVPNLRVEDENTGLLEDKDLVDSLKKLTGVSQFAVAESLENYRLPVIARNNLDPKHPNLWYEEYVPHDSCFYTIIITKDDVNKPDLDFEKPFQIGGNGSVGYGFVKMQLWGMSK